MQRVKLQVPPGQSPEAPRRASQPKPALGYTHHSAGRLGLPLGGGARGATHRTSGLGLVLEAPPTGSPLHPLRPPLRKQWELELTAKVPPPVSILPAYSSFLEKPGSLASPEESSGGAQQAPCAETSALYLMN